VPRQLDADRAVKRADADRSKLLIDGGLKHALSMFNATGAWTR
jgi:hypothetical protein